MEYLYRMSKSNCELRENRRSEIHTLLRGVTEGLLLFSKRFF